MLDLFEDKICVVVTITSLSFHEIFIEYLIHSIFIQYLLNELKIEYC